MRRRTEVVVFTLLGAVARVRAGTWMTLEGAVPTGSVQIARLPSGGSHLLSGCISFRKPEPATAWKSHRRRLFGDPLPRCELSSLALHR